MQALIKLIQHRCLFLPQCSINAILCGFLRLLELTPEHRHAVFLEDVARFLLVVLQFLLWVEVVLAEFHCLVEQELIKLRHHTPLVAVFVAAEHVLIVHVAFEFLFDVICDLGVDGLYGFADFVDRLERVGVPLLAHLNLFLLLEFFKVFEGLQEIFLRGRYSIDQLLGLFSVLLVFHLFLFFLDFIFLLVLHKDLILAI